MLSPMWAFRRKMASISAAVNKASGVYDRLNGLLSSCASARDRSITHSSFPVYSKNHVLGMSYTVTDSWSRQYCIGSEKKSASLCLCVSLTPQCLSQCLALNRRTRRYTAEMWALGNRKPSVRAVLPSLGFTWFHEIVASSELENDIFLRF